MRWVCDQQALSLQLVNHRAMCLANVAGEDLGALILKGATLAWWVSD